MNEWNSLSRKYQRTSNYKRLLIIKNKTKNHLELSVRIAARQRQMHPKHQYTNLGRLRHVLPALRSARVRVRLSQSVHARITGGRHQIHRRRRKRRHITNHRERHRAQILQQIGVAQHPTMRLARPKLHQMPVQFQNDRTVANDEAQLSAPRLQQATPRRRRHQMQRDRSVHQQRTDNDRLQYRPHPIRNRMTTALPEHHHDQAAAQQHLGAQYRAHGDREQTLPVLGVRCVARLETFAVLIARLTATRTRQTGAIHQRATVFRVVRLQFDALVALQRMAGPIVTVVAQARVRTARGQRTVRHGAQTERSGRIAVVPTAEDLVEGVVALVVVGGNEGGRNGSEGKLCAHF